MNKHEVIVKQNDYLSELKNSHELCNLLMKTPHYAKMGPEGVFAIVETAKSLNIDPRQALGGGLYFVKGRVEMQSRMMAALIRSKKHSITRDGKSNDTICILHGKRADTGDRWTESFSLDEAKRAGLVKDFGPWKTYTRDMLYARALSRLARQLFPDVIGNCYVEGEISLDPNIKDNSNYQNDTQQEDNVTELQDKRTDDEIKELLDVFNVIPEYKKEIELFLRKKDILEFRDMPKEMYAKVLKRAKEKVVEHFDKLKKKFSTSKFIESLKEKEAIHA